MKCSRASIVVATAFASLPTTLVAQSERPWRKEVFPKYSDRQALPAPHLDPLWTDLDGVTGLMVNRREEAYYFGFSDEAGPALLSSRWATRRADGWDNGVSLEAFSMAPVRMGPDDRMRYGRVESVEAGVELRVLDLPSYSFDAVNVFQASSPETENLATPDLHIGPGDRAPRPAIRRSANGAIHRRRPPAAARRR